MERVNVDTSINIFLVADKILALSFTRLFMKYLLILLDTILEDSFILLA